MFTCKTYNLKELAKKRSSVATYDYIGSRWPVGEHLIANYHKTINHWCAEHQILSASSHNPRKTAEELRSFWLFSFFRRFLCYFMISFHCFVEYFGIGLSGNWWACSGVIFQIFLLSFFMRYLESSFPAKI